MEKIQIITDGSCDLPKDLVKKNNLIVVPFYVTFDGINYEKEDSEEFVLDFMDRMVENPKTFPKTACPSSQDFLDCFEKAYKEESKIICICINEKFSGSFNSACVGRSMLLEKYPDAVITVIDSTVNTGAQGLVVLETARMVEDGLSYKEVLKKVDKMLPTARIIFTVGNLDYLKHGGRIGALKALIGNTLKMQPIIVLEDGEISSPGVALGQKRAILKVVDRVKNHFLRLGEAIGEFRFTIGITYKKLEKAFLESRLVETLKGIYEKFTVDSFQIGATIATHTGPYAIGVGFVKKYEYV